MDNQGDGNCVFVRCNGRNELLKTTVKTLFPSYLTLTLLLDFVLNLAIIIVFNERRQKISKGTIAISRCVIFQN